MFKNEEAASLAHSIPQLVVAYGKKKAKKIRQRLDEISASSNLNDLQILLQTKLRAGHGGQLIVTTTENSCLILQVVPESETVLKTQDKWDEITSVYILNMNEDD